MNEQWRSLITIESGKRGGQPTGQEAFTVRPKSCLRIFVRFVPSKGRCRNSALKIVRLRTWKGFKGNVVDPFHRLSVEERKSFWFRGQGNAAWLLQSTLDRFRQFPSDLKREACYSSLLGAFRQEMIGLSVFKDLQGEPLELLARHHGLPSPLLDWTESPYIAAFFAFSESLESKGSDVAFYALNRARLPENRDFTVINDREMLRYNERALEQKGVFLRVNSIRLPTEELMDAALSKFHLPRKEFRIALSDLASMGITIRNLFRDLDGAAKSAKLLLQLTQSEEV